MAVRDSLAAKSVRDDLIKAYEDEAWDYEAWGYGVGEFDLNYGVQPIEIIGDIVLLEQMPVSVWSAASSPLDVDRLMIRAFFLSKSPDKPPAMPGPETVENSYANALRRGKLAWSERYPAELGMTFKVHDGSVTLFVPSGHIARSEASGIEAADPQMSPNTPEEAEIESQRARDITEALRRLAEDASPIYPNDNDWIDCITSLTEPGSGAVRFPPRPAGDGVIAFPSPKWVRLFYEAVRKSDDVTFSGKGQGRRSAAENLVPVCVAWFLRRQLKSSSQKEFQTDINALFDSQKLNEKDNDFLRGHIVVPVSNGELWGKIPKRCHGLETLYEKFKTVKPANN